MQQTINDLTKAVKELNKAVLELVEQNKRIGNGVNDIGLTLYKDVISVETFRGD